MFYSTALITSNRTPFQEGSRPLLRTAPLMAHLDTEATQAQGVGLTPVPKKKHSAERDEANKSTMAAR